MALALVFSLFMSAVGAQEAAAGGTGAQMKFTNRDTTYDFGNVPAGSVAQYKFEVKNTGSGNLVITDAKCETPIVKVQWPDKPIKHGKKGLITVTLSTQDIGSFRDDIYITSNATAAPWPFIHVSGAIIPSGDPGAPGNNPAPKGGGRRGRQ